MVLGRGRCAAALVLALCACQREAPPHRVRVSLRGQQAAAAVVVVERALDTLGAKQAVRSVACVDAALVSVDLGAADPNVAKAAIEETLSKTPLPLGVSVDVRAAADEVAIFAVRGPDAFVARAFVDQQLSPALLQVPGVGGVQVRGGRQEKQVRVDLQRLLAFNISLPELVAAAGGAASLLSTFVPQPNTGSAEPASMQKAVPPAGGVKLVDVAVVGLASAGEPLRRDGAVEVWVQGLPSIRAAVLKAALAVVRPAGIEVSALDKDSVEGADILIADSDPAHLADVQRLVLGIPGVHLAELPRRVRVSVDEPRAKALGVRSADIATVVAIATGAGQLLVRNTENVVLRLEQAVPPEVLGQLVVARTPAGPVRLLDVATIDSEPARSDTLDAKAVQRLRVLFDVGVRKNALAALEQQLRSLAGVRAFVERDDVTANICP